MSPHYTRKASGYTMDFDDDAASGTESMSCESLPNQFVGASISRPGSRSSNAPTSSNMSTAGDDEHSVCSEMEINKLVQDNVDRAQAISDASRPISANKSNVKSNNTDQFSHFRNISGAQRTLTSEHNKCVTFSDQLENVLKSSGSKESIGEGLPSTNQSYPPNRSVKSLVSDELNIYQKLIAPEKSSVGPQKIGPHQRKYSGLLEIPDEVFFNLF